MILAELKALRRRLDGAFAPDTAQPGAIGEGPSVGHCAAVAVIVHGLCGGGFVSASVGPVGSHWFNRIDGLDYDLTGDQFGREPVCVATAGLLWFGTEERCVTELREETLRRARVLATRAGIEVVR